MQTSTHAYQLRYTWTAWPTKGTKLPESLSPPHLPALLAAWEGDGMRPLDIKWGADCIRILFSCKPDVAPVFLTQRAKGRLQHAWRSAGVSVDFSRKVSCASVGDANDEGVSRYIESQFQERHFADPRYREKLRELSEILPGIRLTEPLATRSGLYVYALHLVFVTANRWRMPPEKAVLLRESFRAAGNSRYYSAGRFAIMPDHVHLAVRGDPGASPLEIAMAIREETCGRLGMTAFWMPSGYLGTFGPYGMGGIKRG